MPRKKPRHSPRRQHAEVQEKRRMVQQYQLGPALPKVQIWSDGGCNPNPGPGGWACILRAGAAEKELSGAEHGTTNNRMEIMGAIMGLKLLKRPCDVIVFTDSQYLVNGASKWIHSWKARGWVRQCAGKPPVLNADLWKTLDALMQQHLVEWRWVRGHAGQAENERCDQMATAAIRSLMA